MSVEASSGPASVPGQKNKKNKDYSSTTRIYDSDGYRLRSDALCFKDERKQEVLMVSSRNAPDDWTIPGGGLEPNEEPSQTAVREAMEEAGVTAKVWQSVGVYDNDARKTRTNVFTLLVLGDAPNWKDQNEIQRRRLWINTEEAITSLERRQRPLKSRYLKDAYELHSRPAENDTSVSRNGHSVLGRSEATDRKSTMACQDGGCT